MTRRLSLICFLLSLFIYGQVAISEVYYDSPIVEKTKVSNYAHAGEYIELFNYTKKPIDVSGWFISDNFSTILIPRGTIMAPGSFLVFRRNIYRENPPPIDENDYFFKMFNKIQNPKEKKNFLFSSGFILLNNHKDKITLSTGRINGVKLDRPHVVSSVKWKCKYDRYKCDRYYYADGLNRNGINYSKDYYVKSFQKSAEDMLQVYQTVEREVQFKRATPFSLGFHFNLIDLEETPLYKAIAEEGDFSLISYGNVGDVLNLPFDENITLVNEPSVDIDVLSEKCAEYDLAGNRIRFYDCNNITSNQTEDKITALVSEDDNIENKFRLAPNPTRGETTLLWDKDVKDLISSISLIPINETRETPIRFNRNQLSVSINLSNSKCSIYIVKFYLTTGKYITKKIIKLP